MSLPSRAQDSVPGEVAGLLPGRELHPLKAPGLPWRTEKPLHIFQVSMGVYVFERQFGTMVGVKHAFAVTNCTAALHLAHLALGAGLGDTVICPALTFVATANAIRYTGAAPVFADVTSAENCNIASESIAACLDATTKGICVVHYGGYPCDMDGIMALARRHGLYVVEDVAHAPGAGCWVTVPDAGSGGGERVFKQCGSIGDIGCFSFFSNKNLTTAE